MTLREGDLVELVDSEDLGTFRVHYCIPRFPLIGLHHTEKRSYNVWCAKSAVEKVNQ